MKLWAGHDVAWMETVVVGMGEANRLERRWGGAYQDVLADGTNRWEDATEKCCRASDRSAWVYMGTFSEVGNTWEGQALRKDNGLSLQHVKLAVNVGHPGRNGHWNPLWDSGERSGWRHGLGHLLRNWQLKPEVWMRPRAGVKSVLTCHLRGDSEFLPFFVFCS